MCTRSAKKTYQTQETSQIFHGTSIIQRQSSNENYTTDDSPLLRHPASKSAQHKTTTTELSENIVCAQPQTETMARLYTVLPLPRGAYSLIENSMG